VNLPDMEHRYKNALHAHSLTVELLSKLGSNDDNASIERGAWERLEAARLALIGAYLERLGL
jgi:hypothetical protein